MASVRRLLLAKGNGEELEALSQVLQPQVSSGELQLDLKRLSCEASVLQCESDVESHNHSQSLLEDLLIYLVVRKFGASDSASGKQILGTDQQIIDNWDHRDDQQLAQLQNFIDALNSILLESEWDALSLSILSRVVKQIQDPRARERFLVFSFQVLRKAVQTEISLDEKSDTKLLDEAVHLLLCGVTDLWSAIRKDCAKSVAAIVFGFPSQTHIEQFMDSLLGVAIGSRSVSADKTQVTAWTEREGALLALSVLLQSIKMDSISPQLPIVQDAKTSQVKDDIKSILGVRQSTAVRYRLGSSELTQLPRCLVQTLKPAMYQCLHHDQISVRQLAARCLVEYATLCEEPTRLLIFQEVISKLNRMNRNDKVGETDTADNLNESELLDAYEAEGLLDVLARMAPCLPSRFLLKHWKFVFPTLEKYVMHIASSVRQKSSSVVLALAQLSLSGVQQRESMRAEFPAFDGASLILFVQMLLSLSKKRSDESGFCWQQREGRLLSIEVLLNVLGKSLLDCKANEMLRWTPEPTKLRQGRSNFLPAFCWAHEQAQWATWTLNDIESEKIHAAQPENVSLIQAIGAWVDLNGCKNGLPKTSQDFWSQVLSGCIAQTKEAFQSSQFELRRVSRQLLPGLMRLVIWTDQLNSFSSAEFGSESVDLTWCSACVKFILLHLRYLEESMHVLGGSSSFSQKLVVDSELVWNGIASMEENEQSLRDDTEASLGQLEMQVLMFLRFGGRSDSSGRIERFLDSALRLIHANLPSSFQLGTRMGKPMSSNGSLDRQISVFLIPVLPAFVSTLQHLAERDEAMDSSTKHGDRSQELDLSWGTRWLCLERVLLAWLSCDDMFRWITITKSEAQSKLLESLSMLLYLSSSCQVSVNVEFERIIQCLGDIFAASQAKVGRTKDVTYTSLLEIYLRMWSTCPSTDNRCKERLMTSIVSLYCERQNSLDAIRFNVKQDQSSTRLAVESWDDWDEDEIQQASPVGEVQEPCGAPNQDNVFREVLKLLDTSQLGMFYEAVCIILEGDGTADLNRNHLARMQQQIEVCLHL